MTRFRGPLPVLVLSGIGVVAGMVVLEAGARIAAMREERRQGRLDRDLGVVPIPHQGATVTLGQMIRRSEDPRIVYELRPRLDVIFADARVTTSDAGHRGPDAARPKPTRTFRIVGVGDSYMFGQGVADEETYLARLPGLMSGALSAQGIETVNLAVPGFNTVMEVETLRNRGSALEPDLVLIEIVGNDLDLPNFLWNVVDPWTARRSFLLDFVRGRLESRGMARTEAAGLQEAPRDEAEGGGRFSRDDDRVPSRYASMVGLGAFDQAVADLAAWGRAADVPVLAVTHGVWFEREMLAALSTNGIPVLVLRSALRQRARALGAPDYGRSPLALSPHDLHPSALGHEAIAEELAAWIPPNLPRS